MINLKAKPFYLDDNQIKWVNKTLDSLTLDEKAEQLFCPLLFTLDPNQLKEIISENNYGAVMFRDGEGAKVQEAINSLQKHAKVPLLIASNLEDGGNGIAKEGTYMGRQMLIGATNNKKRAYQLGKICGREGKAVGVNWAFAPVLDIDSKFKSPITNVRTYGSNYKHVLEMGRNYIKGLTSEGLIPSIKHFPGDGQDDRDQHLLTSVNNLSLKEWEESYGKIYKTMIDEGVMTVMVGHIAMPAMEEYFDKKPCEKVIPASCSKNIMTGYLRKELHFNGLITTDASPMVGFTSNTKREIAVPASIEAGADIFLFGKDIEEDVKFMKEGIKKGILSEKRLNEAITRILATKAALKLPEAKSDGSIFKTNKDLDVLQSKEHKTWAKECADEGVTLVKDKNKLLPISPMKTKRILLQILGDFESNERVYNHFESLLKKEGFEVTKYIPETYQTIFTNAKVKDFKEKYDLVFYIGNIENASNKTTSRIQWHTLYGAGNNIPWFVSEVPTLFVSVGNPYHLYDVPMIKTYINGYCHSPYVIEAIVEKIMGRSEFKGISPVDPFCGLWDTKY